MGRMAKGAEWPRGQNGQGGRMAKGAEWPRGQNGQGDRMAKDINMLPKIIS